MNVALIATGSELIDGRVHEGNNHFLSRRLRSAGLKVVSHYTVGDDGDALKSVIEHAVNTAQLIIISGGLGPTVDDITFETLQKLFNAAPHIHQPSKERMSFFFNAIGKTVLENDFKMITVPEGAVVFTNDTGLAPGYALQSNGREIIVLPGVPVELRSMFDTVLKYIQNKYQLKPRHNVSFNVALMREAEVDSRVKELVKGLRNVDVSITFESGITTVLLSSGDEAQLPIEETIAAAKKLFGSKLFYGYNTIEEKFVAQSIINGKTVAIAESCTGGLVSKRITDIPGSSKVFLGGVVAYSNDAKVSMLSVKPETLLNHGAVSRQTALEMAAGVKETFGADYGIAVTGIAGPDGGSEEKPVGLVCFGLWGTDGLSKQIRFLGSREQIRTLASNYILMKCMSFAGIE